MNRIRTVFCLVFFFTSSQSHILKHLVKAKIFSVIDSSIKNTECGSDLRKVIKGLEKWDTWAIKMLDANGKINSGVFDGNNHFHGNYDQCLSVQEKIDEKVIQGQYCTLLLMPKKNETLFGYNVIKSRSRKPLDFNVFVKHLIFKFGLCVPRSCTPKDLRYLLKKAESVLHVPFQTIIREDFCFATGEDTTSYGILWGFCAVLLVAFLSTLYDLYGGPKNFFTTFSLYTNTKKLLSTHCQNDRLTCLYGLRVISIVWIIVGHVIFAKAEFSTNQVYILEWNSRWENSFFLAAHYAVDTFFLIGGLLVMYVSLQNWNDLKWGLFYLHRILRLWPPLLATILINIGVVEHLIRGPFFGLITHDLKTNCQKNYLSTLFFTLNYLKPEDRCIPHTWYLATDIQLYIVTPLFIILAKKNPQKTFWIGLTLCCLSFVYTWSMVVANNFGFILRLDVNFEAASVVYFSAFSRLPVYLVGLFLGYVLYQPTAKIGKRTNAILWLLSLAIMLTLTLYHVTLASQPYNVYRSAFFNTFSRLLWALAVGYVIYSCSTGQAGWVNNFLSHPVFIVLGKLSYCMYLIHITVIYVVGANQRQPGYFSTFSILFESCGYLVCVGLSATVLCLLFEAPVVAGLTYLETLVKLKKKQ